MRRPPLRESVELVPKTAWGTIAGMSFIYGFATANLASLPPKHNGVPETEQIPHAQVIDTKLNDGNRQNTFNSQWEIVSQAGRITATQIKINPVRTNEH
jgi:hypothetical protein